MNKQIVVVGAGASGLMAAITAASTGCQVTILESNRKPGEKLLKTGNGRCNFTNLGDPHGRYHGSDPGFAEKVLAAFSAEDTVKFFKKIGIYPYVRENWVYPRSEQAASVLNRLLAECRRLHIKIKLNETVCSIEMVQGTRKHFLVRTLGWHYEADAVILATGSAASLPKEKITAPVRLPVPVKKMPFHPSLTYLAAGTKKERNAWAGARVHGAVSVCVNEGGKIVRKTGKREGQIQFTARGVSGIEVMNVSSAVWSLLEGRKGKTHPYDIILSIDFLPELSEDEACAFLRDQTLRYGDFPPLAGLVPAGLEGLFKDRLEKHKKTGTGNACPDTCGRLAALLKSCPVTVDGTGPASSAQVLGGGIMTSELEPSSMMLKSCPGLFATGENLDIDGECGGWNLQFAWATGFLAGRAASRQREKIGGVQLL